MAVTSLMHFLQESGICRNQKSHKQFKYSITRDKLHLSIDHVSAPTSDHNLLTRNSSDCIKRPICSIRYRYNMLKCRSSLSPDSKITAPCIKTATTTMTGPNPYTSLHGSLCIPKLVMAVGVVVFALWGLEPLVRTTRNVSLHKDDNSWKRCTTNYILRSYLQPLLLWAGTMLVCRTLDPAVMPWDSVAHPEPEDGGFAERELPLPVDGGGVDAAAAHGGGVPVQRLIFWVYAVGVCCHRPKSAYDSHGWCSPRAWAVWRRRMNSKWFDPNALKFYDITEH